MHPRSGFTLIEMSIVLIIIGLVIGGIVVGRDLIRAAEVRATISTYQKLDAAVLTFKTKYNCLPGDCATASDFGFTSADYPGYINGDGNGEIETYVGDANCSTPPTFPPCHHDYDEPLFFFSELSEAGLIPGEDPPLPVQHGPLTSNMPTHNGWWIYYAPAATNNNQPISSIPGHVFSILSGIYNTYPGIITPTTSYQIDSKIDDGMPITGNVQVGFSYVDGQSGAYDSYYYPGTQQQFWPITPPAKYRNTP